MDPIRIVLPKLI